MELIRGIHNLHSGHRGCVATIGNFDGVHLGHQAVLGQLADKAAELGLPALVISFEPHPQEFFAGANAPARLTRFREKVLMLRRFAVDRMLSLRFDTAMSLRSAEAFISDILVARLGVRCLIVGDDFRFGHQRRGNLTMLESAGQEHGFQIVNMHTFDVDGERVSSTRIRRALSQGDLATADKLLGRPYRMSGRVVHGDGRGRVIGFPTANIDLHRKVSPLLGVYAVHVFGLEREPLNAVANIGLRPTVDGRRCLLEVHLLGFNEDIYRRHVQVAFLKKLRDEKRFESVDALKQQIARDVQDARICFAGRHDVPSSIVRKG